MLNVLIPLGAQSQFFESSDFPYSKPLVEFLGKPMIQHVIENLATMASDVRFVFVLREEDCQKFHLDDTIRLLCGKACEIVTIQRDTQGAACSALLALEHIAGDQPLVIANADQVFECDLAGLVARFARDKADAGCLYFESVHPRWSYVRLRGTADIVEAAEKRPISRHAVAGFYYFATGDHFIRAAMASIRRSATTDGKYYIAPVLNELIIEDRRLLAYEVPAGAYHTFYLPKKIEEYVGRPLADAASAMQRDH
jgi:dTDP-glucose pyrophosphorylase